jgi:predicted transcriptional regulator
MVKIMNSSTISARIDPKTAKKLDELAKVTKRTKSFLASEAINRYVEEQSWQIEAIEQGIKEANEGRFASEKDVKKFFSKWNVDAD